MKIAIDASKLNIKNKTGTEIYSEEIITKLLTKFDPSDEITLYSKQKLNKEILDLHPKITNKLISIKFLWTLFGLSMALMKDKPDIFYTPSSIIPIIHPKKSFIVIHGLEYEYFPQSYSLFRFWHLAIFTKLSAIWAFKIITPSLSTKNDLIDEYFIPNEKIKVIKSGLPNLEKSNIDIVEQNKNIQNIIKFKYIFWIGRKEQRKNIELLINIFNIIKKDFPDLKLVLAGKKGYGYKDIKKTINSSDFKKDIIELEFITEKEKYTLYHNANIFVFPSWYEGFGFPILEAMTHGIPTICSNTSSLAEFEEDGVILADPEDINQWVIKIRNILSNNTTNISNQLKISVQKYTFERTAEETYSLLNDLK